MTGPKPVKTWDLRDATKCPGCGKDAIQRIEVRPDEAVIICQNCGAARHYGLTGLTIGETFDETAERGSR